MNEHLGHDPDTAPCNLPPHATLNGRMYLSDIHPNKQAMCIWPNRMNMYEQTRQQTFKVSDSGSAPQQEGHIHG